ncbi:MAG: CocE/NonD family hydrolase [Chloroflexota bacterium]
MRFSKNILNLLGMFFVVIRLFHRWVLAYLLRLDMPMYRVRATHGLRVPMSDGVQLAVDHYHPRQPGQFPTILIRSPYGRRPRASVFGWLLTFMAHRFAERGYHVIVQDVRGRFDSSGIFKPYFNEERDGLETIRWITRQPWYGGCIAMWGHSYLGIVQLVLAGKSPELKAISPTITGSDMRSVLYPDGAFDLGLALRWVGVLEWLHHARNGMVSRLQAALRAPMMWLQLERQIKPAFDHLPLRECDQVAFGHTVDFYQDWLARTDADDPIWQEARQSIRLAEAQVPAHFISGWYDFFLRQLLADYETMRRSGAKPYLTIGPWHHFDAMIRMVDLRAGLRWFDTYLKGRSDKLRSEPVRLYVMGAQAWHDFPMWPPDAKVKPFYLNEQERLSTVPPAVREASSEFTYDPAHPTPALGGAQFTPNGAGQRDNRKLEARPDVLTFTTLPLEQPLDVIGYVRLRLYVETSSQQVDFFGRLCDVYPDGRSMNVCDGLVRVRPGTGESTRDNITCVEIDLWATAYRFLSGHAIRLQVSGGAHPRWNRNTGTGEFLKEGRTLPSVRQVVRHDVTYASALFLPIILLKS